MKVLQFLLVVISSSLFSWHVVAQSIVYRGFECSNPVNGNDPAPTNIPVESRFEVVEKLDSGMFRLKLTGGLPRFVENDQRICIDSDTAIGFVGTPESITTGGLPLRLDSVDATAYFNGHDLVIVINSIYTDLSQFRGTFSSFSTSRIQPVTNTLLLDYDHATATFELKKVIHNKGFVHTSGSTGLLTPFIEIIIPSFAATGLFEPPLILAPPSSIIYRFE
ncbi:MAG: hypothetical protein LV471_00850 [Nitrosomonas sp.]|nr:hypothetical protein [Nitrosomonas sp.]